jgi:hypothetical protein
MATVIRADPQPSEGGYDAIVKQFFAILKEQKSAAAVDYVFGTNPLAQDMKGQITQVKSQFAAVEPLLGELRGHDVVLKKTLADRYTYLLVFAAYDKQPLKIEFVFYKASDKWVVQNFAFNTDFMSDLKALAVLEMSDGK